MFKEKQKCCLAQFSSFSVLRWLSCTYVISNVLLISGLLSNNLLPAWHACWHHAPGSLEYSRQSWVSSWSDLAALLWPLPVPVPESPPATGCRGTAQRGSLCAAATKHGREGISTSITTLHALLQSTHTHFYKAHNIIYTLYDLQTVTLS